MIGLGELLQLGNPELLIDERRVIRCDFVEFVDAAKHFLCSGKIAVGCADKSQCAFEEQLLEQWLERLSVILAHVTVTDNKSEIVGSAGKGDEIGGIVR